jgi:2-polyprenyl-3-methyl-5-hydroxy-6-metoxy-1,4-benzoquinol methylase
LRAIEREKYRRVWRIPSYGRFSPGERMIPHFLDIVRPGAGDVIVDFGTGSGKAARALQKRGFEVLAVDHTRDGISPARWRHLKHRFVEACLWRLDEAVLPIPGNRVVHGYCTDVMEHIPVEATLLTLKQIMERCDDCFFQICTLPDAFGKSIGEPLHVTVMPFTWWRDRLGEVGEVIDARDLMHGGVFHVR